jgi:hypothetical protein
LTVGSGTGFDEEAVKRDLTIMEGVEKEDANKLRRWCDVRGLREDIEKFPKDGKPSDLGGLFDKLGDLLYDMGDEIGAEKAYREGTRRAPAYSLFPHISPPIIHLVEGAPIDTKGEDTGEVLDIAKVWCLIERAKAFSGDVVTSEFMQALSDISVCMKDGDDGNLIALFANLSLELDFLEEPWEDFANKQGADN